ncbi:MAG: hypothetical protein GEU73_02340 [Chloroflexi bacterium]|nr:hypothetical protein [Chloroflexota bacterium]
MQVYTNELYVRRQVRWSGAHLIIAVLVLGVGFIFSAIQPDPVLQYAVSVPSLLIGLLFWWRNQTYIRRWGPRARQDPALRRALRGLDNRYHLLVFPGARLPDYLLVGPMGILILLPRGVAGSVTCVEGTWGHDPGRPLPLRLLLWFAPPVALGNPAADAERDVNLARRRIAERLPSELLEDVSINPVVVFTDPRVRVTMRGCQPPALLVRSLRSHVQRLPRSVSGGDVATLVEAFGAGGANG